MKKILLFIGLSVFSFGAFAEKVPAVIVNKQQGGLTAIINLYNYVSYTPAELSPSGFAQLNCSGSGFTACRVPNCASLTVNTSYGTLNMTETAKLQAFNTAINNVIIQYETALENNTSATASLNGEKGANIPMVYTKTLAFAAPSSGISKQKKTETYVVRGVVTTSSSSSSTMKVYIEKVDLGNVTASY